MSKAIPLRRSRAARTAAQEPARWGDALAAGARTVLGPPRQLWLAGLGGVALAIRGARSAWTQLVNEGAVAEGWLRRGRGGEPGS